VASAHPWLASDRAGPSHRQNLGRTTDAEDAGGAARRAL